MTTDLPTINYQTNKYNFHPRGAKHNHLLPTKLFIGLCAALPITLALPVKALQVQVNPKNPRLGDTVSVMINLDNPDNINNPSVSIGGKTYPVFEIAPNKYRAFIPTTAVEKPGSRKIRVSAEGQVKELPISLTTRKFPVQRLTLRPGNSASGATKHELDRAAAFKAIQTPQKYWNGKFLRPNNGRISTVYGVRRYYNGKFANDYFHRGLDYAGAAGSRVIAPAAGKVALVGTVAQGFRVHGNTVGIDHGQGIVSILLHLSRINVKEGDFVKAGQLIGTVGSTGASTGPHLHWGLYVNGESIDPMTWKSKTFE